VRRERERFHDLVLSERTSPDVDRAVAGPVLAAAARRDRPPPSPSTTRAGICSTACASRPRDARPGVAVGGERKRVELHRRRGGVGIVEPARRRAGIDVEHERGILELRSRHVLRAEREAPARLRLPSGRTVAIAYAADKPPAAAARIQEVFGLAATPRPAPGACRWCSSSWRRISARCRSPTTPLRRGFVDVRKQLRSHIPTPWPDDPTTAEPTSRVRRRS
jgi:hypothetical protein